MAPKRKQTTAGDSAAAAATTTRVTRSSTRLANAAVSPPAADVPEPPKRKKGKTTATAVKPEGEAKSPQSPAPDVLNGGKTIIIERSTECNRFKVRAIQVKEGLEKGVAGVKVVVNPEKPRRGCFEIREEGGEVFLSLLNMKRPFEPMTKLDMEEVISDIIEKIR
ncbi:hypothetical protein Salat_0693000 [Sesamum alatum]|uniref:Selenoprotein H n=1 Tax=Sesamum alatum TaxID=300844 RepID=A0AAE1YSB5_9LAMI|nr:hypothetical protein Salat_0693000 [Sesamum alatum]